MKTKIPVIAIVLVALIVGFWYGSQYKDSPKNTLEESEEVGEMEDSEEAVMDQNNESARLNSARLNNESPTPAPVANDSAKKLVIDKDDSNSLFYPKSESGLPFDIYIPEQHGPFGTFQVLNKNNVEFQTAQGEKLSITFGAFEAGTTLEESAEYFYEYFDKSKYEERTFTINGKETLRIRAVNQDVYDSDLVWYYVDFGTGVFAFSLLSPDWVFDENIPNIPTVDQIASTFSFI